MPKTNEQVLKEIDEETKRYWKRFFILVIAIAIGVAAVFIVGAYVSCESLGNGKLIGLSCYDPKDIGFCKTTNGNILFNLSMLKK